jgi:hypothetical protein
MAGKFLRFHLLTCIGLSLFLGATLWAWFPAQEHIIPEGLTSDAYIERTVIGWPYPFVLRAHWTSAVYDGMEIHSYWFNIIVERKYGALTLDILLFLIALAFTFLLCEHLAPRFIRWFMESV